MSDTAEPSLVAKIVALHERLDERGIGHAFGGALALAFYTAEPRATADIDVNVALAGPDAYAAFGALPAEVAWTGEDVAVVERREQIRLWWGRTPIDLFFRASDFHDGVAERAVHHAFGGAFLPFIAANDLAVFKAMFNRPKDWLDIQAMVEAGSIDIPVVVETIVALLGEGVEADRLRASMR